MDVGSSPGLFLNEAPDMDIKSPMSNIVNDLSRSSLDSGSAKKRHVSRLRGPFGIPHRVNDQRSEGCSLTTSNSHLEHLEKQYKDYCAKKLSSRGLQEISHGKHDCNKENSGATGTSYSRTPQRARGKKVRQPLEIYDENSQDSGHPASPISEKERKRRDFYEHYAMSRGCVSMDYRFREPYASSPIHGLRPASSTLLRSLSSGYESMDDGLMSELIDMEMDEEETQLPSGISKLLSGDIVAPEATTDYDVSTTPEFSRNASSKVNKLLSVQSDMYKRSVQMMSPPLMSSPPFMRPPLLMRSPSLTRSSPLSLERKLVSPVSVERKPFSRIPLSKIRTCLFRSPTPMPICPKRTMMRTYSYDETAVPYYKLQMEISPNSAKSYKRPSEDLLEDETSILKRSRRSINGLRLDTTPVSARRSSTQIALQRSLSESGTGLNETHTNIKSAIHRSITDTDLIGDFSKPCILPLTNGLHVDLKTITSNTLAALIRGEFADRVSSYTIVDCRYPYEYEAGHIEGAVNIYNMDLIQQIMFNPLTDTVPKIQLDTDKRNILVFHCEFSWERGPNLSRVLRRLDRACNKEHYPALYYPETYLLLGGYEKFYSEQKEFCTPQGYKPMKHPNHEEECRFFRNKCKSWQAERTKGISQTARANLERFAF